jgi:hypothetical protein
MRLLACCIASALLLFGLAGKAQAGASGCTFVYAVLECKSTKKGGFEVFAFSNNSTNGPDIDIGDDCADALNDLNLGETGENYGILRFGVSTGTPDKTIYTLRTQICS